MPLDGSVDPTDELRALNFVIQQSAQRNPVGASQHLFQALPHLDGRNRIAELAAAFGRSVRVVRGKLPHCDT
jgi:acetoacetate decarboxylase